MGRKSISKSGRWTRRITVSLTPETVARLDVEAARRKKNRSRVVEECLAKKAS